MVSNSRSAQYCKRIWQLIRPSYRINYVSKKRLKHQQKLTVLLSYSVFYRASFLPGVHETPPQYQVATHAPRTTPWLLAQNRISRINPNSAVVSDVSETIDLAQTVVEHRNSVQVCVPEMSDTSNSSKTHESWKSKTFRTGDQRH